MVERLYDKDREHRQERHQQRMNFGCNIATVIWV
jgi:hypothetical protein